MTRKNNYKKTVLKIDKEDQVENTKTKKKYKLRNSAKKVSNFGKKTTKKRTKE